MSFGPVILWLCCIQGLILNHKLNLSGIMFSVQQSTKTTNVTWGARMSSNSNNKLLAYCTSFKDVESFPNVPCSLLHLVNSCDKSKRLDCILCFLSFYFLWLNYVTYYIYKLEIDFLLLKTNEPCLEYCCFYFVGVIENSLLCRRNIVNFLHENPRALIFSHRLSWSSMQNIFIRCVPHVTTRAHASGWRDHKLKVLGLICS
jgi:hypothetical protein